ncbi:MAG: chemotaxis protein CheW [Burkholderiales bacterium]|nr:chemotaxis protein CheW [Burkholderiales bacterium]
MQQATNDLMASSGQPLLPPTEALRRGFQFEGTDPIGRALAVACATSGASAAGASEIQQREGFFIGHLGLMIRYEDGSELSDMPATYQLPNAPDWFTGIANLHGLLVPVFDLASYLGIEHQPSAKPMLLVLGHGADAAGVLIDGLPLRLRFTPGDCAEGAPVPALLEACVHQTCWAAERTWMDLLVPVLLGQLSDELAATGQQPNHDRPFHV